MGLRQIDNRKEKFAQLRTFKISTKNKTKCKLKILMLLPCKI